MYKLTCIILVAVIALLQYQFWQQYGKVRQLQRAVDAQLLQNDQLAKRNAELIAEVEDLRAGDEAVEERARSQLGLIGKNEQFIQLVPEKVFQQSQQLDSSDDSDDRNDTDGFASLTEDNTP